MERGLRRIERLALPRIDVDRNGLLVLAPRLHLYVPRVRSFWRWMEPKLVGDRRHARHLESRVRHLWLRTSLICPDGRPPRLRSNPGHEGCFDGRPRDHDDTLTAIAFVYLAIAWKSRMACTS